MTVLEWIANVLGLFSVDWETDFEDDGYTSFFGLAPLDEPVLFTVEDTIPYITILPDDTRQARSV